MAALSEKTELKIQMLRKAMEGADAGPARNSGRGGGDSGGRWRSGPVKKAGRPDKDPLDANPTRSLGGKQPPGGSVKVGQDVIGASGGGHSTPSKCQPLTDTNASSNCLPPTSGSAASNLQAALQQQSSEAMEVATFLAGLGLDRYVSLFMENGFDCMEVVQLMDESHMREIGMATGHVLKLRKRLAELNPSAPALAEETAKAAGAVASGEPASSTQKRVSFGQVEQSTCGAGSLLDGHYDEAEQQASFQEAVRAWREGGSETAKAESTEPMANHAPGSFWSSLGENEVNLSRCSTPLHASTGTLAQQSEMLQDPALNEPKLSCYQCYRQFYAKHAVERTSPLADGTVRRLCSDACANQWIATMEAKAEELCKRQEKFKELEEMYAANAPSAEFESGASHAVVA